jgi:hypothetical protein
MFVIFEFQRITFRAAGDADRLFNQGKSHGHGAFLGVLARSKGAFTAEIFCRLRLIPPHSASYAPTLNGSL